MLLFFNNYKSIAQTHDYKLASVYVYNFIKYIEFPQPKTLIKIGILGSTPLETELQNLLTNKKYHNFSFSIKNATIENAKNFDVIVVSKSASSQLKALEKATSGLPILVISEKDNLGRFGACICFTIDEENDNKLSYQLSLRNCKMRGLNFNQQILNNAILTR